MQASLLKIGNLKLKSNLILAPMSGISDLPFRILNRNFGCELAFIEMINCRSLGYKSKKTTQMLATCKKDRPLGLQLLGSEPKFMLRALDILNKSACTFDILDFNAACPEKKVVRRGEGASLLKEPGKLRELLKLLVKNSKVPVTVKIRAGWDRESINAREVALLAEGVGVSAIFIHGRTRLQEYSGNVDYSIIRNTKKSVCIPVIASGDIFSGKLAKKMLEETGCDGLAIARGALGNPWIFKEIKEFLKNGRVCARPDKDEIIAVMLEHLNEYAHFYEDKIGVIKFRKFFAWYTKGLRKIRPLRERSSQAKTVNEMGEIIKEI